MEGRLSDRETASAPAWPVRAAPYLVRSSDFTPSHFLYLKWITLRAGLPPVLNLAAKTRKARLRAAWTRSGRRAIGKRSSQNPQSPWSPTLTRGQGQER